VGIGRRDASCDSAVASLQRARFPLAPLSDADAQPVAAVSTNSPKKTVRRIFDCGFFGSRRDNAEFGAGRMRRTRARGSSFDKSALCQRLDHFRYGNGVLVFEPSQCEQHPFFDLVVRINV